VKPRIGAWILAGFAVVCAACSIAPPAAPEFASYDFGPAPQPTPAASLHRTLVVHDAGAPAWVDSTLIHYRLAYQDAPRPRVYADSRWVMSPALLFSNRLRGQLAASGTANIVQPGDGTRAGYALRVDLEEFVQVFDAPGRSRALLQVRVLLTADRELVAQKIFRVEHPSRTADAEGGVRALIAAGDAAIDELVAWTRQNLKD
jgi:cholesterol transport system auxiliary component